MKSTTHLLAGALVALLPALALGLPSVANATPVTTWGFDITSQWTTADTHFSSGIGPVINDPTTLAWGNTKTHPKQSSLVINPASANGSVDTYEGGGTVPTSFISDSGIIVTHNNFVISLDSQILKSAVLSNSIQLTPFVPPGSALSPFTLSFNINFDETPNTPPCADITSPVPCNDIFVISHDSLNHTFSYGGDNYFLSLFPRLGTGGINVLTNAECAAAGAANGCFGFTTEENKSNPLNFGLTISTTPITNVPEPGTLGMMGLGLLGIGFAGYALRRRKLSTDSLD